MSKLDEFLEYLNCDCSDGNCIFRPSTKKGMVTNGGCKCTGDYNKRHELARLIRWLRGNYRETDWTHFDLPLWREAIERECDCEHGIHKYSVFKQGVAYCAHCGKTLDYEESKESYE